MRQLVLAASLVALAGAVQANADLTKANNCVACHAEAAKKVGPSYKNVAKKYAAQADAVDYLTKKIKAGGAGVWGRVPMPAYPQLSDADSKAMATYIMSLK